MNGALESVLGFGVGMGVRVGVGVGMGMGVLALVSMTIGWLVMPMSSGHVRASSGATAKGPPSEEGGEEGRAGARRLALGSRLFG